MTRIRDSRFRKIVGCAIAALALSQTAAPLRAQTAADKVIADTDLSGPLDTRPGWRFVAYQAPDGPDRAFPDQTAPGAVTLCLHKEAGAPCAIRLEAMAPKTSAYGWDAHYLDFAKVVHPPGGAPLLMVRTRSLHSADGGQAVFTQLFAYRPSSDRFVRVYDHVTGTNNNQEVRYIASGPLAGGVVVAEPTSKGPYRFWVTVSETKPGSDYRQVLRYRSATGYNDGNVLKVIDSEMPNIERRLGLWRPGQPLPLPAAGCARPELRHMELWCS